jgi:hypothetical protein
VRRIIPFRGKRGAQEMIYENLSGRRGHVWMRPSPYGVNKVETKNKIKNYEN